MIIAMIGKLIPIIALELAFHMASALDLRVPNGLGAQLVRPDT
jgi:hypothetical protein